MNLCFQREDREFSIQDKPPKTRSTKKAGQILKEFRNVIISAYPEKINEWAERDLKDKIL